MVYMLHDSFPTN